MLTIDEIKNVGFTKKMGGYKSEEVDEFIDDVVDTVNDKDAQIKNLEGKLDFLAKKVEEYRKNEDTVRNAMLVTQKSTDAMIKEAKEKAVYYKKAAEEEIKKKLVEAQINNEKAKEKLAAINADAAQLKKELIALYHKHIDMIDRDLPDEEDLRKSREIAENKYPFESTDMVEDASGVSSSIVYEKETEEDKVRAAAKELEEEENTEVEAPTQVPHDRKFNSLQFGDNYDVE